VSRTCSRISPAFITTSAGPGCDTAAGRCWTALRPPPESGSSTTITSSGPAARGHPQGGRRPVDSEWRNLVQATEKKTGCPRYRFFEKANLTNPGTAGEDLAAGAGWWEAGSGPHGQGQKALRTAHLGSVTMD